MVFRRMIDDVKKIPYTGLFVTTFFLVATLITFNLTNAPLHFFARADEITIPEGFTAREYLQAVDQADLNDDGVISVLDYAMLINGDYGASSDLEAGDVNFDSSTNALDVAFLIENLSMDVDVTREKIFESPQFASEINDEIVKSGEEALPSSTLVDSTLTIESAESGSSAQYGRTVIPQVLGTVSAYSGAATYERSFDLPGGPGGFTPSLGLRYSSASIDDSRNQGSHDGEPLYENPGSYAPSMVGYGFGLSGIGSIVRDTRDEKEVYKIKGKMYHRYILSLPGGVSAELKYNPDNGTWVSIPQGFLKIDHRPPVKVTLGDNTYLDPWDWVITTKDGMKYYFGEEDVTKKIDASGRIIGSADAFNKDGKLNGTKGGNLYMEFDTADLCKGNSERNPCSSHEEDGKVLLVTKWLLRKVEKPDGNFISYTYDSQQHKLDSPWKDTQINYVTSASYPKEITWNDAKHRVRFEKEARPDKGRGEYMQERIKEVIVETKEEGKQQYSLVRKYVLSYFDQNTQTKEALGVKAGDETKGIDNSWKASFLTSLQEFGTDNDANTALPAMKIKYSQYKFPPQGYGGGEIYVSSINNGYGGETQFAYQAYETTFMNASGGSAGKNRRLRVIEKKVADAVTGKTSRETYTYGDAKGYVDIFREAPTGEGGSGEEFLGHSSVEVKSYDYDNSLLSHSESFFNQANVGQDCFEPHPAKGRPYRQVVYKGDGKNIVQETLNDYRYRLDATDGLNPSDGCNKERINQPLFLYTYDTISVQKQPAVDFVPDAFKGKVNIPTRSELRTKQRSLAYDEYGNETQSVNFAEVDSNNEDINKDDNRYSFAYFLTSGKEWIKNLPYLIYQSNNGSCAKDSISCQWGRSKMYYDNFDKNYTDLTEAEMQPRYGLISQQESWIEDDVRTVEGYEYWDISGDSRDADMRKGPIYRTYGPKANIKTVANPTTDIILTSERIFDRYYNTLVLEQKNALGHKTLFENYNVLLQLPQTIKKQIQKDSNIFEISQLRFDSIGRLVAEFGPDPDNPGKVYPDPTTVTRYFEKGDKGLAVRSAILVSQASDGKSHYQTTDTFYNGVGNIYQTQVLEKSIEGKNSRLISDKQTSADGASPQTFELQIGTPVTLSPITASTYQTALNSPEPTYIAGLPKTLMGEILLDQLRRPYRASQIDTKTQQTYVSTTEYGILSSRDQNAKGLSTVTISDVYGRPQYTFTVDKTKSNGLMTSYEYENSFAQAPKLTTITDSSGKKISSSMKHGKSGRLITMDDPSLGKYSYTYDVMGNKITQRSQPREDIEFEYDNLGRLVKKKYPSLASGELYSKTVRPDVVYNYDIGKFALGQLSTVDYPTGSKTLSYDGGQNITKTVVKTFDVEKTFETKFNKLGLEESSIYPDGTKVSKNYDQYGMFAQMKIGDKETYTGSTYDIFGHTIQSRVNFNNAAYTARNTFDNLGRLRDLSVSKRVVVAGAGGFADVSILSQQLRYNAAGELGSLDDIIGLTKTTFTYGYDGFSQLKSVSSSLYQTSYEYDLFGRILRKDEKDTATLKYSDTFPFFGPKSASVVKDLTESSSAPLSPTPTPAQAVIPSPTTSKPRAESGLAESSVESQENQLAITTPTPTPKLSNTTTLAYDIAYTERGAMKADEQNCYFYNRESELKMLAVRQEGKKDCREANYQKVLQFYYDETGALNLQEEYDAKDMQKPLKQTYFFGLYEETKTFDKGAPEKKKSRIYIPTVAHMIIMKDSVEGNVLMVQDYLGSTRVLEKDSAGVGIPQTYYPYGQGFIKSSELTDKKFTGHRELESAGIYQAGARFYNQNLGVFIQADKHEGPQRYAYGANNPSQFTDPSGNCTRCLQAVGGGTGIQASTTPHSTLGYDISGRTLSDCDKDIQACLEGTRKLYVAAAVVLTGIAAAPAVVAGGGITVAAGTTTAVAAEGTAGAGTVAATTTTGTGLLATKTAQGIATDVGFEALTQAWNGEFKPEKLVEAGVMAVVWGKWGKFAKGYFTPRVAALAASPRNPLAQYAEGKVGKIAQEFIVESASSTLPMAYGMVREGDAKTPGEIGDELVTGFAKSKVGKFAEELLPENAGWLVVSATKKAAKKVFSSGVDVGIELVFGGDAGTTDLPGLYAGSGPIHGPMNLQGLYTPSQGGTQKNIYGL